MLLIILTTDPLEEQPLKESVEDPTCGAALLFHGVVRNHHEGKPVSHIDYHCYEEMARSELHKVAEDALSRFPIRHFAVAHRYGVVKVGEPSLLVAASSAHRAPVFEGLLYFVDELKKRVPIWKKEYGPDGHHWVQGVIPKVPEGPR